MTISTSKASASTLLVLSAPAVMRRKNNARLPDQIGASIKERGRRQQNADAAFEVFVTRRALRVGPAQRATRLANSSMVRKASPKRHATAIAIRDQSLLRASAAIMASPQVKLDASRHAVPIATCRSGSGLQQRANNIR